MGLTAFSTIKNNVASLLNSSMDAAQGNLQLVNGAGTLFPAAPFYVSVEFEVMRCTAKAGDTLTVSRGQDGTTAAAHAASSIVEMRGNAALWTEVQTAVNAIEGGTNQIPFNPPAGSITNSLLAADVPQPNLLQNGGFENWIFGATPATTNGAYPLECWRISGANQTVTREATIVDTPSQYSAKFVIANSTQSYFVNDLAGFYSAPIPGDLKGRTLTFSIRVRTNTANAVRAYYFDGATEAVSSYHPGDDTWRTLTFTVTIANNATVSMWGLTFTAAGTIYVDNAVLVYGTAVRNYYPPLALPNAVPNARLGTDAPRYNLLTNGGFEIWQRGNGPFSANAARCADCWAISPMGSDAFTVNKETTTTDGSVGSAAAVTFTFNGGSTLAGPSRIYQHITMSDGPAVLPNKVITFAIRIRATTPGVCRAYVNLYNGSVNYMYSQLNAGSTNYETLFVTAQCPSNMTILQVGVAFFATGNVWMDNASVVLGPVPTDCPPLHPADEQDRCERYYEIAGGIAAEDIGYGLAYAATTGIAPWQFRSKKASTPTINVINLAGSGFAVQFGSGTVSIVSALGASSISTNMCNFAVTSSAMTGSSIRLHSNNNNAVVAAEANV